MTRKNHDARALAAIGERSCNVFDALNEKVDFATLFRLYTTIYEDGDSPVHAAFTEVICRLIEIALIRDPVLERVVQRWAVLSVRAPQIVRSRVAELTGFEPPDSAVQHLVNILGGSAVQRGRRVASYEDYLPDLFARHAAEHPRKELRCAVCGYHFVAGDLNPERLLHAENSELVLADSVLPGRIGDTWKPLYVQVPGRKGTFTSRPVTGLTIDHVVPEEGLGWAGADNLEILCNFCNVGKLAYRWALEPVSQFGAGGLADYPAGRPLNKLAQTTIVSALRYSGGKCIKCSKTNREMELTVRPTKTYDNGAARGFTPWNMDVLCYECV